MKNAALFAFSLEVVCRDCGECIENTVMDTDGVFVNPKADGSTIWTIEQVKKASGKEIICPACDEPMKIVSDSKAQIGATTDEAES